MSEPQGPDTAARPCHPAPPGQRGGGQGDRVKAGAGGRQPLPPASLRRAEAQTQALQWRPGQTEAGPRAARPARASPAGVTGPRQTRSGQPGPGSGPGGAGQAPGRTDTAWRDRRTDGQTDGRRPRASSGLTAGTRVRGAGVREVEAALHHRRGPAGVVSAGRPARPLVGCRSAGAQVSGSGGGSPPPSRAARSPSNFQRRPAPRPGRRLGVSIAAGPGPGSERGARGPPGRPAAPRPAVSRDARAPPAPRAPLRSGPGVASRPGRPGSAPPPAPRPASLPRSQDRSGAARPPPPPPPRGCGSLPTSPPPASAPRALRVAPSFAVLPSAPSAWDPGPARPAREPELPPPAALRELPTRRPPPALRDFRPSSHWAATDRVEEAWTGKRRGRQ
ncbi:basic salivary proline-rich protein 2-like [Dipodomys merriami]|uniref:basic salivary proline-rich protein 2-like n=1 Tax=Dipodomys merriami TaxID=94247 RepID=UPI0038560267